MYCLFSITSKWEPPYLYFSAYSHLSASLQNNMPSYFVFTKSSYQLNTWVNIRYSSVQASEIVLTVSVLSGGSKPFSPNRWSYWTHAVYLGMNRIPGPGSHLFYGVRNLCHLSFCSKGNEIRYRTRWFIDPLTEDFKVTGKTGSSVPFLWVERAPDKFRLHR